jgi:hypothetical protein
MAACEHNASIVHIHEAKSRFLAHPDRKAVLARNCHKVIAHLKSIRHEWGIWDAVPHEDVQQLNKVLPHKVLPEYEINLKMQMCKVQCNAPLNIGQKFVAEQLGP